MSCLCFHRLDAVVCVGEMHCVYTFNADAIEVQLVSNAWHASAGKYTVPILWDKKEKTIVNNESSEIMRMFNRQVFSDAYACCTVTSGGAGCGCLCNVLSNSAMHHASSAHAVAQTHFDHFVHHEAIFAIFNIMKQSSSFSLS